MSALPSYALAPLPAGLAPAAWHEFAACRFDDRDLFFPPDVGAYGLACRVAYDLACRRLRREIMP